MSVASLLLSSPPPAPAMPGGAGAEASRGDRWIDSREIWALVPFCHQLALRLSVKKRRDVPWSSPRFILPVYFLCVGQSRQEEIISSGSMGSVNFCITSSLSHLPKRLDDFPFRGRIGHFFLLKKPNSRTHSENSMELSSESRRNNSSFSLGRWKCFQFSHPVTFVRSSDISKIAKSHLVKMSWPC